MTNQNKINNKDRNKIRRNNWKSYLENNSFVPMCRLVELLLC